MQDQGTVDGIIEALRAVRDKDTCFNGLQRLQELLQRPEGDPGVAMLLQKMPAAAELGAVWDTQLLMKDSKIATALLQAVAGLLSRPEMSRAGGSDDSATPGEALAAAVLAVRMKSLYHFLGSGNPGQANATLALLTAVARLGPSLSADLVRAFDFALPAFSKAALVPRRSSNEEGQHSAAAWMSKDATQRPVCASFVEFSLALLVAADAGLLGRLLRVRQLFDGLLNGLQRHPPFSQHHILGTIWSVLQSHGSRLAPALQAEAFSDAALGQLAGLAQHDGAGEEDQKASDLALEILTALGTDEAHGLCLPEETSETGAQTPGQRKLGKLLQKLRPAESPRHFKLLCDITSGSASLAAAYLGGLKISLEPRLDTQWLAGMAALTHLVEASAAMPSPVQARAAQGNGPPGMDSTSVRALLKRLFPPVLGKAQLTKGCQSPVPLVRYVACCTLRRLLSNAAAVMLDISNATAAASSTSEEAGWQEFQASFQNAVRARIPDVAVLRSVLSVLQPELGDSQAEQVRDAKPKLTSSQLTAVPLLAALESYLAWLPEAMAEAGFDAGRLLSKDVAAWPAVLQGSLLRLVLRACQGSRVPFSLQSTEALCTLLHVAGGSGGAAWAAREAAESAAAAALGIPADSPELWLWLEYLPGNPESRTPVARFLAEAVVAVARRPQELYELVLELDSASSEKEPLGFSLLTMAALSAAIKVLGSAKMAQTSRAAIAGYVAGVLIAAIQVQRDPQRLCQALLRVLAAATQSQAEKMPADDDSPPGSPRTLKRKRPRDALLALPEEGLPIALLHRFADSVSGTSRQQPARPVKKRKSADGSTGSFEGVFVRQPAEHPETEDSPALTAQLISSLRSDTVEDMEEGTQSAALLAADEAYISGNLARLLQACQPLALAASLRCHTPDLGLLPHRDAARLLAACDAPSMLRLLCSSKGGMMQHESVADAAVCKLSELKGAGRLAAGLALLFWAQHAARKADISASFAMLEDVLKAWKESDSASLTGKLLQHPVLLRNFLADSSVDSQGSADRVVELLLASSAEGDAAAVPYIQRLTEALEAALTTTSPSSQSSLGSLARKVPLLPPASLQLLLPAAEGCAERYLDQQGEGSAAEALLPRLALALQGQCGANTTKAVARLAGHSSAARRVLADGLEVTKATFWRRAGSQAQELLAASLRPGDTQLTQECSLIAHRLVDALLPCRLQFEGLALRLLTHSGTQEVRRRRETTALLLPTALAFFQQVPLSAGKALAEVLRDRLLAFVASSSSAEGGLSKAAEAALHQQAVPVLIECLGRAPLSQLQQSKALKRLLPGGGWPCRGAVAQQGERAASLAAFLVQSHAWDDKGSSAVASTENLVRFAACCFATLAKLMTLRAPDAKEAQLASRLWADLDGWMGDALADRPEIKRGAAAAQLAAALLPLAAGTLQRHLSDAGAMKSLRRLLAALLPAATEADNGSSRSPELADVATQLLELLTRHSQFERLIRMSPIRLAGASWAGDTLSLLPAVESGRQVPGQESEQACSRREVLELLEVILDLLQSHSPVGAGFNAAGLQKLPEKLLPGYNASLEAGDRALLRALHAVDRLITSAADESAMAVLHGPLLTTRFLWGEAAAAAADAGDESSSERTRHQLLTSLDWLEVARVAITVTRFPESRTLAGDEEEPELGDTDDILEAGGYDPAFLLPFCLQFLGGNSVRLERFAATGLLSLCLRCLAAEDVALRALAYEAVALCTKRMRSDAASFKGKSQLQALLDFVARSVLAPFQQLPAISSVFLAEAAIVLLQPASPLYPPVCKLITGSPRLRLEEVPMMTKLLMSCSSETHAAERTWILQLLSAGAHGWQGANICRKRFAGELLLSLHDSPLASPHLQHLCLGFLCSVHRNPGYAADLAIRAGLVPWLSKQACSRITSSAGRRGGQSAAAVKAITALRKLLEASEGLPTPACSSLLRLAGPSLASICAGVEEGSSVPYGVLEASVKLLVAFLRLALASQDSPKPGWQPLQLQQPEPSPHYIRQLLSAAAGSQAGSFLGLQQDLLDHLLSLQLSSMPAMQAGAPQLPVLQQSSAVCQWLLQNQLQSESASDAAAFPRLLAWLGSAAECGAQLCSEPPNERREAGGRVLAAFDRIAADSRLKHTKAAVTVLLHLLHPVIATAFGIGSAPEAEAAAQEAGLAPEWRFLLGNTLLRLLDSAGLPRFGPAGSHWPRHGIPPREGRAGCKEAAAAALQLLLLLLGEWMSGGSCELVVGTLLLWQQGKCGEALAAVGRLELVQWQQGREGSLGGGARHLRTHSPAMKLHSGASQKRKSD